MFLQQNCLIATWRKIKDEKIYGLYYYLILQLNNWKYCIDQPRFEDGAQQRQFWIFPQNHWTDDAL